MTQSSRRIVLAERPTAMVNDATTRMEQVELPDLEAGEALVKVRYISIDPTIRTWMDDAPGYLPPIAIGEVVRSGGVAEVIDSNSDAYSPGDLLFGMTGWQEYLIADEGERAMQKLPPGVAPTLALSAFGITGMTAYFGMTDVGRVKEGDVVVVSGAAGATGSTAGQIARLKGAASVIGIAGSDAKCALLTEQLGFDGAINYKTEDVAARLRELCPAGIDLYWDNVGGNILDACLGQLALRGRVVLCGAISSYNDGERLSGPANYRALIVRRGRMEGFIILDYVDRFPAAQAEMAGWLAGGEIKSFEHIVEGLERSPEALNLLFSGGNTGKVMVKL